MKFSFDKNYNNLNKNIISFEILKSFFQQYNIINNLPNKLLFLKMLLIII